MSAKDGEVAEKATIGDDILKDSQRPKDPQQSYVQAFLSYIVELRVLMRDTGIRFVLEMGSSIKFHFLIGGSHECRYPD